MSGRLHTVVDPALPPLAWHVAWDVRGREGQARAGTSVVVGDDRLIEGAWAGPFPTLAVDEASIVLGSGVVVAPGGLLVVPPSDTHDRLHLLRRGTTMHIANSLVLLLVATGARLDTTWPWYPRTYEALVCGGWGRPMRTLPTAGGEGITALHLANVLVDTDGGLRARPRPLEPAFTDFASYRGFLSASIAAILENAGHGDRPRRYGAIQTVSAGFDSPCVAVLTAELGVRDAVTFVRSRAYPGQPERDDGGGRIAAHLGMNVITGDRHAYRTRVDHPEAEFLATGMPGEEIPFGAFEAQYAGRVVFTGHLGGQAWGDSASGRLERSHLTLDATSVGEFRLRTDYIQAPVPSFGLRHRDALDRLRTSPEMAPWRLGGGYDRPVARRIIEEAGIERGTFAVRKAAVNAVPHADAGELTAATRAAIAAWWAAQPRPWRARVGWRLAAGRQAALILASRVIHRAGLQARLPAWIGAPYRNHEHGEAGSARFLWAVERLRARYGTAVPPGTGTHAGPGDPDMVSR